MTKFGRLFKYCRFQRRYYPSILFGRKWQKCPSRDSIEIQIIVMKLKKEEERRWKDNYRSSCNNQAVQASCSALNCMTFAAPLDIQGLFITHMNK